MLTLFCRYISAQTRALESQASRKQARKCVPTQTGSGAGITPYLEEALADERDEVEPDPASSESALGFPSARPHR